MEEFLKRIRSRPEIKHFDYPLLSNPKLLIITYFEVVVKGIGTGTILMRRILEVSKLWEYTILLEPANVSAQGFAKLKNFYGNILGMKEITSSDGRLYYIYNHNIYTEKIKG